MATPEGKIKLLVKKWMLKHKIPNWSIIPSAMGNTTGVADICAITKDGRWLAVEVKAEGKRGNVTANQQQFLDTIYNNGGRAYVVSCADDLAELEKILNISGVI